MNSFVISYDISKTGDYENVHNLLVDRIQSYGVWAHITDSCWAIRSDTSAVNIRNFLWSVMRAEDRLIVIQTAHVAAWNNTMCNNDWLRENI